MSKLYPHNFSHNFIDTYIKLYVSLLNIEIHKYVARFIFWITNNYNELKIITIFSHVLNKLFINIGFIKEDMKKKRVKFVFSQILTPILSHRPDDLLRVRSSFTSLKCWSVELKIMAIWNSYHLPWTGDPTYFPSRGIARCINLHSRARAKKLIQKWFPDDDVDATTLAVSRRRYLSPQEVPLCPT